MDDKKLWKDYIHVDDNNDDDAQLILWLLEAYQKLCYNFLIKDNWEIIYQDYSIVRYDVYYCKNGMKTILFEKRCEYVKVYE